MPWQAVTYSHLQSQEYCCECLFVVFITAQGAVNASSTLLLAPFEKRRRIPRHLHRIRKLLLHVSDSPLKHKAGFLKNRFKNTLESGSSKPQLCPKFVIISLPNFSENQITKKPIRFCTIRSCLASRRNRTRQSLALSAVPQELA